MAARAMVPVEVTPCARRFRGHGPLLQGHAHSRGPSRMVYPCRSGRWPPLGPVARWVYQQGEGPLHIPPVTHHPLWDRGTLL